MQSLSTWFCNYSNPPVHVQPFSKFKHLTFGFSIKDSNYLGTENKLPKGSLDIGQNTLQNICEQLGSLKEFKQTGHISVFIEISVGSPSSF